MNLDKNQILITREEAGHILTVQIGSYPPVSYSSCPNKPTENITNSIEAYLKKMGLEDTDEWKKKGCSYEGDPNSCRACN